MITVHKRLPRYTAPLLFVLATAAALPLAGCDDDSGFRPPPAVGTISLTPDSAAVKPGGQVPFTAEIEGLVDKSLIWSVNGLPGGDVTCGTISAEGMYTAPSVMPEEPRAVVRATSAADTGVYGEALVTIVQILLTPDSAAVKPGGQVAFTAEIEGLEDKSLIWSVNGLPGGDVTCGTISAEGLYTAPSVMPEEPHAFVRATSAAYTAVYEEALVTIIGLLMTPPSAAAGPGEQITFTVKFSGVEEHPVAWSVNGIPGGSAELGTIDASGLYTAPAVAPSPRTVTVGAKSEVDDTMEASAAVTVLTLELLPVEFTIGAGQSMSYDAVVHGLEDAQVSWYVDGDPGGNSDKGTIDSDGVYTAPVMISKEFSATITAECTDHPTAYADATVTVVMPVKVELEDWVSFVDLGSPEIYNTTCGAASGGWAVEGFTIVGESLAYEVSFDLEGYYGGVLQAAALKGYTNEITVTLEGAGPGGEDQVAVFEIVGRGIT